MLAHIMDHARNVAVLEVAWGGGAPWFRINPRNFSGRRLYQLFGPHKFVVTNACPEVVDYACERGTPSPSWLRANLAKLQPTFVLLCGRVAESTFSSDMVAPSCMVHTIPHPAARTWTNDQLAHQAAVIRLKIEKEK